MLSSGAQIEALVQSSLAVTDWDGPERHDLVQQIQKHAESDWVPIALRLSREADRRARELAADILENPIQDDRLRKAVQTRLMEMLSVETELDVVYSAL